MDIVYNIQLDKKIGYNILRIEFSGRGFVYIV